MAADAAQLRAQRRALEHFVREGLIGGLNADRNGDIHFLQIGGNDGVVADPLRHWHAREPWRGTIVEPIPAYFAKLSSLHAPNPRMRLLDCAVSDQSGELTLWHVEPREAAAYPAWTQGLASTDRQHLVRHNVSPDHCASVVVPCVTPEMLCRTAGINALDLLCVDVEGHELAILQAFPFEAVPVTLTIFEAWHMPPAARAALATSLQPAGMAVVYLGEDGVIVSSGDHVRRAFLEQLALYLAKFDNP